MNARSLDVLQVDGRFHDEEYDMLRLDALA